MRVSLFLLVSSLYTFCSIVSARTIPERSDEGTEQEEYYWKEYKGTIPRDAFPGGKNVNGKTTYIGQVLHENQLIPANIDPEKQKVYYEWGYKEFEATENIKILCTKHPEFFEWFHTGNRLINNITDKTFVIGGYEKGFTILIGRKQLKDELAVGKVIFTDTQSTLNTTKDGIGTQHAEFEVLCYNPNIKTTKKKKDEKDKKISIIEIIDVRYGEITTPGLDEMLIFDN